jgi:hypothetical protein
MDSRRERRECARTESQSRDGVIDRLLLVIGDFRWERGEPRRRTFNAESTGSAAAYLAAYKDR